MTVTPDKSIPLSASVVASTLCARTMHFTSFMVSSTPFVRDTSAELGNVPTRALTHGPGSTRAAQIEDGSL